jgi:hypothetical protein
MIIPVLVAVSQATWIALIRKQQLSQRGDSYLGEGVLSQAGIENGIGDLVTVRLLALD